MGKMTGVCKGTVIALLAFCLSIFLFACKKEASQDVPQYPLRLSFINKAGTQPLVLNTSYTNPHGEPITITQFKYYISNISLIDIDDKETKLPDTYFLVDQNTAASTSFIVNAPGSAYKAVRFIIGVDSARNVSGVQTGALDPANGMFWTWITGYIMAKMEGTSSVSTAPLAGVTYHIGGFKTGENVLKQITLNLPTNVLLKTGAASEVVIDADAMAWFKGAHNIKIATDAFCMNPGTLAMQVADNYAQMFSVEAVNNQ